MNLAYIIYPECNIKLIGIDLNNSSSFYQEELKKHPEFVDWKVSQRIKSQNRHDTVIKTEKGTVIDRFHLIQQKLAKKSTKLLCCNTESLLIQDDICEYSPIIS